jgi:hypothetical protein
MVGKCQKRQYQQQDGSTYKEVNYVSLADRGQSRRRGGWVMSSQITTNYLIGSFFLDDG